MHLLLVLIVGNWSELRFTMWRNRWRLFVESGVFINADWSTRLQVIARTLAEHLLAPVTVNSVSIVSKPIRFTSLLHGGLCSTSRDNSTLCLLQGCCTGNTSHTLRVITFNAWLDLAIHTLRTSQLFGSHMPSMWHITSFWPAADLLHLNVVARS